MAFERDTRHEQPCPCGKGRIRIVYYEPDHGWPSQNRGFETELDCDECNQTHEIREQRDGLKHLFVLVNLMSANEAVIYDYGAAAKEDAANLIESIAECREALAGELATLQERARLVCERHQALLTEDERRQIEEVLNHNHSEVFGYQIEMYRKAINEIHERVLKVSDPLR